MTPTPRTDVIFASGCSDSSLIRYLATLARTLERENAELLEALESIMPYIEGDTKVPWKPALAAIAKTKGKP